MGYKKSFNLVTIQLIIPLSTMTKAEYKNAYGIDLDDIDIEKVTLLQDEGSKDKYFVDEIKTTESGIDIYAGGKILSIGSSVSVVNNAYSVENSKPIYCHPISIEGTSSNYTIQVALLIFDNSPEEYDTYTKLLDKLNAIFALNANAIFPITGGLYNTDDSTLHVAQKIYIDGDTIRIGTIKSNGTIGYFNLGNFSLVSFYDGVNKIN